MFGKLMSVISTRFFKFALLIFIVSHSFLALSQKKPIFNLSLQLLDFKNFLKKDLILMYLYSSLQEDARL